MEEQKKYGDRREIYGHSGLLARIHLSAKKRALLWYDPNDGVKSCFYESVRDENLKTCLRKWTGLVKYGLEEGYSLLNMASSDGFGLDDFSLYAATPYNNVEGAKQEDDEGNSEEEDEYEKSYREEGESNESNYQESDSIISENQESDSIISENQKKKNHEVNATEQVPPSQMHEEESKTKSNKKRVLPAKNTDPKCSKSWFWIVLEKIWAFIKWVFNCITFGMFKTA